MEFIMKGKSKVRIRDIFVYGLASIGANYIASLLGMHTLRGLIGPMLLKTAQISHTLFYFLCYLLNLPPVLFLSLFVSYFVLKRIIPKQYAPSDTLKDGMKKVLVTVLPGEIGRLILCSRYVGIMNDGGRFGYIPSVLYDTIYIGLTNRHEPIRQLGEILWQDRLWYFVFYMIYLCIYLCLILFLCNKIWKNAEQDGKDMIFHERYQSKPKLY